MAGSEIFRKHANNLANLKSLVEETERRLLAPDPLFVQNANFFIKSYLITLCTYLEAFQQEKAFDFVRRVDERIRTIAIPKNVVHWAVTADAKDRNQNHSFENFSLCISREKVSDELSGNPGKTVALFKALGVDLRSNSRFSGNKDIVFSVVGKRNKVIHHNDQASDVSLGDVKTWSQVFVEYSLGIDECVDSHLR